jgi:hypothetical protein
MEVHPPDHPIHTMKDFLIHMATIVLGLLIALGLEESVKAYERHETHTKLKERIRKEAKSNVELLNRNLTTRLPDQRWIHSVILTLIKAKPENGVFKIRLPIGSPGVSIFDTVELPSRGVWTVAKTNGEVALLGLDEAKAYNRLDFAGERYLAVSDLYSVAENDAYGLEERMQISLEPGELLTLSPAQRDEVLRLFAQLLGHLDKLNTRTANWAGAAKAIENDIDTYEGMNIYIKCAGQSVKKGDSIPPTPECTQYQPR